MTYVSTLPVVCKKEEIKNGAQIIITIYAVQNGFVYSINCKLRRFIRSYYPTPKDVKHPTPQEAQCAAVCLIQQWVQSNRKLQALLLEFEIANYRQLSLFENL